MPGTGGGSSADSILSSSSGHLLSETGTPGTISSASSMDDIDSSCRSTLSNLFTALFIIDFYIIFIFNFLFWLIIKDYKRNIFILTKIYKYYYFNRSGRDSTKSDSRVIDDNATSLLEHSKTDDIETLSRSSKSDSNMRALIAKKSSSIKSLRRNKNLPDFEALPENVVADLKGTTQRRTKPPPSPLNLNLRQVPRNLLSFYNNKLFPSFLLQDLTDSDFSYSPYSLKSPKDGTQSLNRTKKIGSPGNSSVPSSPSRHSDFFCEFGA